MNPVKWSARTRAGVLAAAGLAGALALTGCDNGPSAVETRTDRGGAEARFERRSEAADRTAYTAPEDMGGRASADDRETRTERRAAAAEAAPDFHGRPLWSASRRYDAEANAHRAYERNGQAVGARSYEDFLEKAHAFTGKPPKGALTLTRANGDRLIYEPKANLFAVVTRDGAPRTLFKPDDGMAYWEEQKTREAERARDGGGRSRRGEGG